MNIFLTLPHRRKACSECLKRNTLLFTVTTKTGTLTLCEKCAKEATNGIINAAIKARDTHIAHG